MTQIQQLVNEFIDKNIDIRRAVENDIISIRKLAKYIAKKLGSNQYDAVISSIRRYEIKQEKKDVYKKAISIVKKTKISTKSNIVSIAIEKDDYSQNLLPKLFDIINYNKGEVLRIIQAEGAIKLIVDEKNLKKIENIIPKDKIILIEKDLSEINLCLDDEAVNTPGIISLIFSELMINAISINEAMSCVPEMMLFVKEKELLKTYSILFNLIKG
jgi:hypothetical protein